MFRELAENDGPRKYVTFSDNSKGKVVGLGKVAIKDGNGSGLDRVEQYQIHIHIHEDSLCPPMKISMDEKLCPCPNLMDIHTHWISIGSSRDI